MKTTLLRTGLLTIFIILCTISGEGKDKKKSEQKENIITLVKKDNQSGRYQVQPKQESQSVEKQSSGIKFDQKRFEKELKILKKNSEQHAIRKQMYQSQQQAERERGMREVLPQLDKMKLFGKSTRFFTAPFAPTPQISYQTAHPMASNLRINGKLQDTISVHDPFAATFSFAPGYVSAIMNIYFDADSNGVVSAGDILLEGNILLIDDDENDTDPAAGAYRIEFNIDKGDFPSRLVSSLLFEVNDYQSVSSAMLTVRQKPTSSIVFVTVDPPKPYLGCYVSGSQSDYYYAFTNSAGKFSIYVDRQQVTQLELNLFDFTGVMNGYIPPQNTTVSITADTTRVNFTFVPATSFIEGYVKDQNGVSVKNASMSISTGSFQVNTKTDSLGYYKVGVIPGSVYLYVNVLWSADYMQNSRSSTNVTALANKTVRQDIVLIKASSSISGKVTLNGNGIGGIRITVSSDSLSNNILTSVDGNYTMPVYKPSSSSISYNVHTNIPSGYYALTPSQYGIQPGATNVNFVIKKVTGGLQGTITDSKTGKPIPHANISVSGTDYRNVYSNDSGYFRMSLIDGTYLLSVNADFYFSSLPSTIVIAGGMMTKNITLLRSGSFSGSVKNEEGNPIYNANIQAIDTSGYSIGNYGYPDNKGNYTVGRLKTSLYGASVYAQGYIKQWFNKVNREDSATFFHVTEGFDTPNINFVLSKGGTLSGRVVDKFGNGIKNVEINVTDTLSYSGSYGMTNDSGYYSVSGLATGNYFVRTYNNLYIDQWYNGVTTQEKATSVHVVINQNTSNINFTLSLGASISGIVKNKNNIGIPYAYVTVLDSTFNSVGYGGADGSGYYIISRLESGKKYYVTAGRDGYSRRWYNNVSTPDSATPIILQSEEKRENINFTLSATGSISGKVLDDAGTPIAYASVNIQDSAGIYFGYGSCDSQGKYTIQNLSTGKYYAAVYQYLYQDQWFDHKATKQEADKISVVEDKITENINFNLHKLAGNSGDSVVVKIELANIPDSLLFSQSFVNDYSVDYWWGIRFATNSQDTIGEGDIELALIHWKNPGEKEFKSTLIDGTSHVVMEWIGNSGYHRHTDVSVSIDPLNKNTLVLTAPKLWTEINRIKTTTKYNAHSYYYSNNGIYIDTTIFGQGSVGITDPIGDVPFNFIDIVSVNWETKLVTDVPLHSTLPINFSLQQNYPNPFNPTTVISYQLPVHSYVTLKIYDAIGRTVATVVNETKEAGSYDVKFDATKLSSGIYFYKIQAGNFSAVKKLLLVK